MKKYFFTLLVLCLALQVNAQKKIKYDVDLTYFYGLSINSDFGNFGRSDYKMNALGLRASVRYQFSEAISAGLGLGLDGYHNPDYNTFPVFITAQYAPLSDNRNAFLFADLGRGFGDTTHFNHGTTLNLGAGYKLMTGKNFGLTFRLGYNVRWADGKSKSEILNETKEGDVLFVRFDELKHTRHSIITSIGITF